MLIKIDRQEAFDNFPNLPLRHFNSRAEEDVFNYPKVFANYVLTLFSKSYKGHISLLGREIANLTTKLEFDKLIFLGDEKTAWLYRDHDFKPAKEALQYLIDHKIGKRFNGAIQVDTTELPIFIKHLCWLVSCNAVLPTVHFIDPGQTIIGNICQFGNLHISTMTATGDLNFKEVISKSKFSYLTDGNCYYKFSKSGAIKGRVITV